MAYNQSGEGLDIAGIVGDWRFGGLGVFSFSGLQSGTTQTRHFEVRSCLPFSGFSVGGSMYGGLESIISRSGSSCLTLSGFSVEGSMYEGPESFIPRSGSSCLTYREIDGQLSAE
jgi:hypothetical protein